MSKKIQPPLFSNCLKQIFPCDVRTLTPLKNNDLLPKVMDSLARKYYHHLLFAGDFTPNFAMLYLENIAQQFHDTNNILKGAKFYLLHIVPVLSSFEESEAFEKDFYNWQQEIRQSQQICVLAIDKIDLFNVKDKFTSTRCLSALLKTLLTDPQWRMIVFANQQSDIITHNPQLAPLFEAITLTETNDDTLSILKTFGTELESFHKITIDHEVYGHAMWLADKFLPRKQNLLEKSLQILDSASARISGNTNVILTKQVVNAVISDWTHVPFTHLANVYKATEISQDLQQRIHGQEAALSIISLALHYAQVKLTGKQGTFCNFIFAGPSGVGKSTTALELTKYLFGNENALFTIIFNGTETNLTDVCALTHDGNVEKLTAIIKVVPYAVFLLPDLECASKELINLLQKIISAGVLLDNDDTHDFTQAMFIFTTTLGAERMISLTHTEPMDTLESSDLMSLVMNNGGNEDRVHQDQLSPKELTEEIFPALEGHLPTLLLQQMNVAPFTLLDYAAIEKIVLRKLNELIEQTQKDYGLSLAYTKEVPNFLTQQIFGKSDLTAAIDKTLGQYLYPSMVQALATVKTSSDTPARLLLKLNDSGYLLRCEIQESKEAVTD